MWLTETGYDVNQGSPFKAIPIKNKSAQETQADWILRTSLLYARTGIEWVFFYGMYDDNISNPQQFSSSGLINNNKTRKPAADYIYQVNKLFGGYTYQQTINDSPVVDRYAMNNNTMYVIFVPEEKGTTSNYTLDLGTAEYANVFTPRTGSDDMEMKTMATVNGKLFITATETPLFITPVGTGSLSLANLASNKISNSQAFENTIKVYPNPVSNTINVTINNKSDVKIKIKIFSAGSGSLIKNIELNKPDDFLIKSINVGSLPAGYYMIEIQQGSNKVVKKIMKMF